MTLPEFPPAVRPYVAFAFHTALWVGGIAFGYFAVGSGC